MKYAIFVVGFFSTSCLALGSPKLVYMEETEQSRHIIMSDADGRNAAPLTAGSDWHIYPDISADGGFVVYAQGKPQSDSTAPDLGIVGKFLQSGVREQWIETKGMNLHPRLSGNGETLAFSGPQGEGGQTRIALINLKAERANGAVEQRSTADGVLKVYKPQLKVIPSDVPCYFPSPASDAHFVVFQRNLAGGKKDIVHYDLESNKLTRLSEEDGVSMAPALSFDDRFVAYTSQVNGNWDIYMVDLWKKITQRVTTSPSRDFAPTFKPDGSIVFASDSSGHFELYEIRAADLQNANPTVYKLVGGSASYYAPQVSGEVALAQGEYAPILNPARSSFGTAISGGKVYVVGGHQGSEHTYPPESFLDTLESFDLATKHWTKLAPRPVASHGFQVVAHDKYIYAFGGFTYSPDHKPKWKSIDRIDRYNIETNTWQLVGTMPRPRSSNVAALHDGKVYLIGGWDSTPKSPGDLEGRFHREIDVFDLATETVSTSSVVLPDPLRRAFSGVSVGNEIVLVGGLGVGASHFELLNKVTAFNPTTGAWRELATLPFSTFAPAVGNLNGALYVFGGMFKTGEDEYRYVNHVFQLENLRSESWKHTGRFLKETKGFSQVVPLNANTLGVLGGHTYHDDGTDSPVQTFETWSK